MTNEHIQPLPDNHEYFAEAGPQKLEHGLAAERALRLQQSLDKFLIEPGTGGEERRVIANILPDIETTKHQMVVAPVGSGKTLAVPAEVLLGGKDKKPPKKVIIVQPTQQLTANASEILRTLYGDDLVGHRYGGMDTARVHNPDGKIQVVTTGILWNMLKRGHIGTSDYVFFDEVHQTMGFPQIEAALAALTHQYEQGERYIGLGLATGTFPTESESGRRFLDFVEASMLETGETSRWHRELLPGGRDVVSATKNYLSDSANNGRNLLVLVPTNRKVDETVRTLNAWAEPPKEEPQYSWRSSEETKRPAQPFRTVFFSKDIGAGEFNRQVTDFLRDRTVAKKAGRPFDERLIIVATYGSAGSGVNYPVEDGIGDATYIKAVDEDRQTVQLQESSVTGSVLQQAFGRIGRHTDGRFYLVGYEGSRPLDEMLKPDPLPTPLKSSRGLQEAIFGLIEAKVDPRAINEWYSRGNDEMKREIEKTYAILASCGLLKEGRVMEIAQRISKNPLADQDLSYALTVEAAETGLRGGLQEILATADSASWRSLFVKAFNAEKENGGRNQKQITTLLLEKGLLRRGEEGKLMMPDSDEPLPDSDTAIIVNVAKYLRDTKFEVHEKGKPPSMKRLSLGEMSDRYNLSYKALERLMTSLKQADEYNHRSHRDAPRYYTQANWDKYLRTIIEGNNAIALQAGYGSRTNHNIISEGVYRDGFMQRSASSELVASLKVTKAQGVNARVGTVFTGSVLGKIPEDLVQWLPENLEPRASAISREFDRLKYMKPEERDEFAQKYPQAFAFFTQCADVATQTADFAKRAKQASIPTFDFQAWYKEFVLPHMMVQKVDNMDAFNAMLVKLGESGVSVAPELHNFVSPRKIEQINKDFPAVINLGEAELPVRYDSYYNAPPIIEVPDVAVPVVEGRFQVQLYPISKQGLSQIQETLASSQLAGKVKIKMAGKEYSLEQLGTMPDVDFEKTIALRSLEVMAQEQAKALSERKFEKPTIDQNTLLEMLGGIKSEAVAVVDGKRVGTVHYLSSKTVNKGSFGSSNYVDVYSVGSVAATPDKDPFETQYNSHSDKNYFVKGVKGATLAAYYSQLQQATERMNQFVTAFSPEQAKKYFEGSYSYSEYRPTGSFTQLVHDFTYLESKRLYTAVTTSVEGNSGQVAPVSFDVERYKATIEGYFGQLDSRFAALGNIQEQLAQLNQIDQDGNSLPYKFNTLLESTIKTTYSGSEQEFTQNAAELSGYADYVHRNYQRYTRLKGQSEAEFPSFTDWLSRKENALEAAEKVARAVPVYLSGESGDAIYVVYDNEAGGWAQYTLSEDGGLYRRKGYGSRYVGRRPEDVGEYFGGQWSLGKRGEGLKELNLAETLRSEITVTPSVERAQTPFGPSKHELNRKAWIELSSQTGEGIDTLVETAMSRKPTDVRKTELATVFALTGMPYGRLEKIVSDPERVFPHLTGARQRLNNMVKEVQRRTETAQPTDLDKHILARAQQLEVVGTAVSIARRLNGDWIGEDSDLQNRVFTLFLTRLSEEKLNKPEIAQALAQYESLQGQNKSVPVEIVQLFIECA